MNPIATSSLLLVLCLAGESAADPGSADVLDPDAKDVRLKHLTGHASGYSIFLGDAANDRPLDLQRPLLRFNDNVTGVLDGILIIWTEGKRPRAAASFWMRTNGDEFHEFQSLASGKLLARRNGEPAWSPQQRGIEPRSLDAALRPAETAPARLSQMRRLARQFQAAISNRTGRQKLRLMPQPVYRYEDPESGITDGAMFSFSKGTNPEVLLLIEAAADGSDERWRYALARMTMSEIEVRHEGQVVVTFPYLKAREMRLDPTLPYFTHIIRRTRSKP